MPDTTETIRRSPTYRFARANGYGVADAVEQMRSASAFRAAAASTTANARKQVEA